MKEISRDRLLDKIASVYKLTILAARRTIELTEGAAKLVDADPGAKPSDIALKEIAEGRISYKIKDKK